MMLVGLFLFVLPVALGGCTVHAFCKQQQAMTPAQKAAFQQFKAVVTILGPPDSQPPHPKRDDEAEAEERWTFVYKKVKVFRLLRHLPGSLALFTRECHDLAFLESTQVRQLFYPQDAESCTKLKVGSTYFLGGLFQRDPTTNEHVFYLDPCYQHVLAKLSNPGRSETTFPWPRRWIWR